DPGDMTIRRVRVTNFTTKQADFAAIDFDVTTGTGTMENVLIDHVAAPFGVQCNLFLGVDGASAGWNVRFLSADFAGETCAGTGTTYYVSNTFTFRNSIFWNSGPGGPPSVVTIWNNQSSPVSVQIYDTLLAHYFDKN